MREALICGVWLALGWGCAAAPTTPSLGERMASACTTLDGCDALLLRLKSERNECMVGPRPSNCEERERNYLLLRQHLRDRREALLKQANVDALAAGLKGRDEERQALQQEHAELAATPTDVANAPALSDPEEAWRQLDPKRCAIQGDEAACYALFQYLNNTVDSPHRGEAQAALEAGRKLIAERQGKPAGSAGSPPGPSKKLE